MKFPTEEEIEAAAEKLYTSPDIELLERIYKELLELKILIKRHYDNKSFNTTRRTTSSSKTRIRRNRM